MADQAGSPQQAKASCQADTARESGIPQSSGSPQAGAPQADVSRRQGAPVVASGLPSGWELSTDGAALCCLDFPARHGFSTRLGGVSPAPYESLNVGLSSGDDPGRVRENRRRFGAAAGFSRPWISAHQVHGAEVAIVGGDGLCDREHADAVVTTLPGQPIGVYVADCTPVLLADRRGRAIAAIHAGWRGTVAGVVPAAIEALRRLAGVEPEDLCAAIGPAARRCCYEVGHEVVEALEQIDPGPSRDDREGWLAQGPRREHVDLPVMVRRQLRSAGLLAENIHASGLCTLCRPDLFFSYRRDGAISGRMVAVVERAVGAART